MLGTLLVAFGIFAICAVIHTTSIVTLAEWLEKRPFLLEQQPGALRESAYLIAVFGVLITLHLIETAIWAGFYRWLQLFADFETALYFSIVSYATIGYGDVVLPRAWRLLGCIEGFCGVLLCGLSGAFVFVVLSALFQVRKQAQN